MFWCYGFLQLGPSPISYRADLPGPIGRLYTYIYIYAAPSLYFSFLPHIPGFIFADFRVSFSDTSPPR